MRGIVTLQRGDLQNRVFLELRHADKQLLYASSEDQRMKQLLGRVSLKQAQLEQVTDGLVIHEAKRPDTTSARKFILKSTDTTTLDAWFYAIYSAITDDYRIKLPIHKKLIQMKIRVTSSLRDEQSDQIEFELSCDFLWSHKAEDNKFLSREKSVWIQHEWTVWKSQSELQTLHRTLQSMLQSSMKHLVFPRERRRDVIFFRGLRKRFLQELKEQQMGLYFDQLTALSIVCADPQIAEILKQSLNFDIFFDQVDDLANQEKLLSTVKDELKSPDRVLTMDQQDARVAIASDENDVPQADTKTCAWPIVSSPDSRIQPLGRYENVLYEENLECREKIQAEIVQLVRANQKGRIEEFHHTTREFGRGKIQASEMAAYLHGLLGAENCFEIILEMAKLLPDEEKREKLLQARESIRKRAYQSSHPRDQERKISGKVVAKDRPKSEKWMRQGVLPSSQSTHRRKTMFAHVPKQSLLDNSYAAEEARLEPIDEARSRNRKHGLEPLSFGEESQQEEGRASNSNKSTMVPDSRRSYLFSSSSEDTDDERQPGIQMYAPGQDTGSSNSPTRIKPFSKSFHSSTENLQRDFDEKRCISENSSSSMRESLSPKVDQQPGCIQLDSIRKKTRPPSIRDRHQQLQEKQKLQINDQEANPVLARLKKQGAVNFMAF
ncbi:unnamed protein product [Albugo candida]|nr:unnamed protein product [Albugo candida]|eukprot:CCI42523.1 unnamed protein product [Albugo candida]